MLGPVLASSAVGLAAEHLVCADLLLAGYKSYMTDQSCAYDVVLDSGQRLVRIQVKAATRPRSMPQRTIYTTSYMWHVRRAGKGARRVYGENEFDALALVALDIRQIAYVPPSQKAMTIHIKPPGEVGPLARCKQFEDYPIEKVLAEL